MAKLENKERNALIELTLYPDLISCKKIGYKLYIGPPDKATDDFFILAENEIFFEVDQLEIPEFCDGIMEVLNEDKPYYFFEPFDQSNFQFFIKQKRQGDGFYVLFQSRYFRAPNDYSWPSYSFVGVKLDFKKQQILDFVDQLQQEYSKIIETYSKDQHCKIKMG